MQYTSIRNKVITPEEMAAYTEAQKGKWTQREGVVLKIEDSLRNFNPFWALDD